jgi:hypothetical protein
VSTTTQVTWYVARRADGQFCRGESWVPDIARARLYRTVGPAKSAVTKWAKANPDQPVPEVLEWRLDIATATVLNVTIETKKRMQRAARMKLDQQARDVKWRLASLDEQEKRIADERARLEASETGGETWRGHPVWKS